MADTPSIFGRVARAQLAAVAGVTFVAVAVGAAAGVLTTLRRDDATALAMARVFAAEIANHVNDPGGSLDDVVRHEVEEQVWFGRQIEVWRGDTRLGGDGRAALIGPTDRPLDRCQGEVLAGRRFRVCGVAAAGGTRVFVASPIGPLVLALSTVLGTILGATVLAVLVFAAVNRRLVHRAIAPLARLGARIGTMRAAEGGERLGAAWGATEVDRLAAMIDALLDRVEEALQRERRFLADASHELRTPLTRLRSHLDLAIEGSTADEQQHLRAAQGTCEALVRTCDAVLALARSEVPDGTALNVADLARELLANAELYDDAAKRVAIAAPDEVLVRADPALVALAINNLVDNALKFSPGPVLLRVEQVDARAVITVEDEGPGIRPDELEQAFEPFFRSQLARAQARGVGLGLALVRHVATAYGGEVTLENRAEGGLRATLTLPGWTPR